MSRESENLWRVAAYYGPDVKASAPGRRGAREGELAFESWHTSEDSMRLTIAAAQARPEIGTINAWFGKAAGYHG
jgi:hypothetical protein